MALTDNQVSYWKLDESSGNASDSVASNTLSNINTATYEAGKISNSVNLVRASAQYLRITDASQTGLDATGDITIACWIYFDSFSTGNLYGISSKWRGNQGFFFYVGNGANQIGLRVNSTDKPVSWTPSLSTWYHVAFIYTASAGSVSFYVNGSQQGSTQTSLPTSITDNDEQFAIGVVNGTAVQNTPDNNYWDGQIDEVGFWSRTLSGAEISQLYNAGTGITYPYLQNLTLTAATGAYTYTGVSAGVGRLLTLTAGVGSFILTGIAALFQQTRAIRWTNLAKTATSSFTNRTKNSATNVTNTQKSQEIL